MLYCTNTFENKNDWLLCWKFNVLYKETLRYLSHGTLSTIIYLHDWKESIHFHTLSQVFFLISWRKKNIYINWFLWWDNLIQCSLFFCYAIRLYLLVLTFLYAFPQNMVRTKTKWEHLDCATHHEVAVSLCPPVGTFWNKQRVGENFIHSLQQQWSLSS